jgi:transposase
MSDTIIRQPTDRLWEQITPIWLNPKEKSKTGRPRHEQRDVLAVILHKFRSGDGWKRCATEGASAFRLFKELTSSGKWTSTWRKVIEFSVDAGFGSKELMAATESQIAESILPAEARKWVGYTKAEFEALLPKPYVKKEGRAPSVPRERVSGAIWLLPDGLWSRIEPIITEAFPRSSIGRPMSDMRIIIDMIINQARTGCQWQAMGNTWGINYSTAYKWTRKLQLSGVYDKIFSLVAEETVAAGLTNMSIQALDGSLGKSRKGGELVGPSPFDRAKKGIKYSVLVEATGLPLSIALASANTNDSNPELLRETLSKRFKPAAGLSITPTLIVDKGYRGKPTREIIESEGYIYRAPPRDADDPYSILDIPLSRDERVARAKVEHCHSWLQSFRAIMVRYARTRVTTEATVNIVKILIWYRRLSLG